MRKVGLVTWVCGLAALLAAAPAQAAFPGVAGPIAYSHVLIGEGIDTGGLLAHGPRKRDAPVQLTESPTDNSPSYSPNGRLIVFAGNHDPGLAPQGSHIYLMKRDGSGVKQLTSSSFYDSNPSFSPNGKLVVFDRGGLQGRATQIFSVSLDGSSLRAITDESGSDSDPTFTPNGKRIVFVSNRMTSGIAFSGNRDHGPNLFAAKINGKHVRELTHSRHDCFGSACYTNPSWSPDGKHIAFLSSGRFSSDIAVMRVDGRGVTKEFDTGGTEEEGFGSHVGAPGWGSRPR
ncbi:MAG TPA: hypothetical protein VK471_09765 [Solirubrobacterales bacterium]|nr:hypothetical protein [Solirubrobacterales bacterium]